MSDAAVKGTYRSWLVLDPRVLILLSVFFALICVITSNIKTLTLLLLFSMILAMALRANFNKLIKTMLLVDGFMLVALGTLPFTVADISAPPSSSQILGFDFSWTGVWLAVGIALKTNSIMICSASLVGRLSMAEFSHALVHLKVPATFVQILLLMVRYVDVLGDEMKRLRVAMKCRGFKMRSSWHCWRSFGYLIGMTFLRSFERGEQIMIAMKCRGFRGTFPLLHHFHAGWRDGVFILLFISSLVVIFGLSSYWGGGYE